MYWAAIAWEEASCEGLANAWKKLLPLSNNNECDNPDDLDHGSTSVDNDEELQEMFVELGYQEDNNEWQSPAEWLQNDSGPWVATDDRR